MISYQLLTESANIATNDTTQPKLFVCHYDDSISNKKVMCVQKMAPKTSCFSQPMQLVVSDDVTEVRVADMLSAMLLSRSTGPIYKHMVYKCVCVCMHVCVCICMCVCVCSCVCACESIRFYKSNRFGEKFSK
jgi:hypothetical protein